MFLDFDGWHSFGGNATYDRGNCSMSFNVVVLLPIKTNVDFQTCHRHCVYGLVTRFVCNCFIVFSKIHGSADHES